MTAYMVHTKCGRHIAQFVGKEQPVSADKLRSRDFRLLNGRRPDAFSAVVCPYCKCVVQNGDFTLEPDNVIEYPATHSD